MAPARKLVLIPLLLIVATVVGAAGADEERGEAEVVVHKLELAIEAGDVAAALSLFSDQSIIRVGDTEWSGKGEIRRWLADEVGEGTTRRISGLRTESGRVRWTVRRSIGSTQLPAQRGMAIVTDRHIEQLTFDRV